MLMLFLAVHIKFCISAYDLPGVPTAQICRLQRSDVELADLIAYLENDRLSPESIPRSFRRVAP